MSLYRTVAFLAAAQHPAGSWSDFVLAPGTSDTWVTAYTGTALALIAAVPAESAARADSADPIVDARTRAVAARAADAAAGWLRHVAPDGTWGWNRGVHPDADSTAWAVRLLALRGHPVPGAALDFLAAHRSPDGYRTYRSQRVSGSWAAPTPEVTAAVLLTQHAAGVLDQAALAAGWRTLLLPARAPDGWWHSLWWPTPAYPSALVGALWTQAGRPNPAPVVRFGRPRSDDRAWRSATELWAAAAFGTGVDRGVDVAELVRALLDVRRADGGWAGSATLRVPAQRGNRAAKSTVDARGIFTTATALHALLAAGAAATPVGSAARVPASAAGTQASTTAPRYRYDELVTAMATAAGADARGLALPAFRALTRESLTRPGVWPARQLSSLAGGTPLEFSVGATPALRLTAEVGDPLLPPHGRMRSGLRAVARTARLLGMAGAWRAVRPAVDVLADPRLPVPEGNRFWVWAGLDLEPGGRSVLKVYLSAHAEDVPGWRARERAFLTACGVPPDAPAHTVLDRMAEDGWCHELGIGLVGADAWGIKVYYELSGYRPAAVRDVLDLCGLDSDPAGIAPDVPGVLRASLAARRRSGIAVRIHPRTGRVDEVTVAAAFPAPLVGRDELATRVTAWLAGQCDVRPHSAGPHAAAVAALLPSWQGAPAEARMHSLFTRSRSRKNGQIRDETKVYLRPGPAGPGNVSVHANVIVSVPASAN